MRYHRTQRSHSTFNAIKWISECMAFKYTYALQIHCLFWNSIFISLYFSFENCVLQFKSVSWRLQPEQDFVEMNIDTLCEMWVSERVKMEHLVNWWRNVNIGFWSRPMSILHSHFHHTNVGFFPLTCFDCECSICHLHSDTTNLHFPITTSNESNDKYVGDNENFVSMNNKEREKRRKKTIVKTQLWLA